MGKTNTFREITDREELEKCFKMRYSIYAESVNKVRLCQNVPGIDINAFDVHSKHYCLLKDDRIVGYLRIVFPRGELVNTHVLEIANSYELPSKITYSRQTIHAPYPFLSYRDVPRSHWNYYTDIRTKGEQLIEASRLILDREHRGLNVSRFLIECALVLYIEHCSHNKRAIVDCFTKHSTFYKSYGFTNITGDSYLLHGIPNVTLSLPPFSEKSDHIPEAIKTRLMKMAEEFRMKGWLERVL
jgi:predicted GNAT family N-acyltransferase